MCVYLDMRSLPSLSLGGTALAMSLALATTTCGGHHHLAEYNFANRSMALVYLAPPSAELRSGIYDAADARNPVDAVVRASSGVAKEVEGRRARVRLDSASARVDLAALVAQRTLDRASRYLGARPVTDRGTADFLLEVNMRNAGIDARGQGAAYLFMNATTTLLDARTGREIWSRDVHGYDRLTPYVYGGEQVPTGIITAAALSTVSVADFQRVLEQLAAYSSDRITDDLRDALRDVRAAPIR